MAFEVPYPAAFPMKSAELMLSFAHTGQTPPDLPQAINAAWAMLGFFAGMCFPEAPAPLPTPGPVPSPMPPPGLWKVGTPSHAQAVTEFEHLVQQQSLGGSSRMMTSAVSWQLVLGLILDALQKLLAASSLSP